MDKKEFRVLIKHCFLTKKNTVETKAWLDKHYSDSAPGKSTVEKWFAKFKRGEMSTEDDARSGRPKEAVTDENIKKVHKIILDDRKLKLIQIAEALKISKERVGTAPFEEKESAVSSRQCTVSQINENDGKIA